MLYKLCHDLGEEETVRVLQAYFIGEGERERELGAREAEWLACTVTLYGIPPRRALALTNESEFPVVV